MTDETSYPPVTQQDDLNAMAELLNQSSLGTEAARSLRGRSPWETAKQIRSGTLGLDLITLVVAMGSATDIDLDPDYKRILSLCQVPISVVEVAAKARLPLQVVTVLLSDLVSQRLILFRSPATPTAEPSSRDVVQKALAGRNHMCQDSRTELAVDTDTVSEADRAAASMPVAESIDADLEQALAASGFARLPVRWQEVFWWMDVEDLSPADAAPILGMTPHGVAALAYRVRQSLKQCYTWARLDDAQQRPEDQDPRGHDQPFGALLRQVRLAAGISIGELARRINYSKSQVSKIENRLKPPTMMFAKMCDRALSTGGVLAAAVASQPEVDDHVLALLRASFDHYGTLGTMTNPAVLLAPVIAHVHTLRTLAVDKPEPMRSELLLLAARVAEYAGWLCQESGREADALRWLARAVTLATNRDPHLASVSQFRQAEIALYQHDPQRAVELARCAQEDTAAGPRILGLAASCEAQGHALMSDLRAYEEALDRAANLLAVRGEADGPILDSTSVPDEIALVRGWSLYELGRPGTAAELLDTQLAVLPPSARRARARFGIRRALAHAANGEIDQACVAAAEVLPDVAQVKSVTCRPDLHELSRTLSRWSTAPAVRGFQRELSTLLDTQS